jgi:phosphoenolpyruvate synthase/pyruvate phosphate dikinase
VNGVAIPFGLFRQHMAQLMPGTGKSYWQFLQDIFKQASDPSSQATTEDAQDHYILSAFEQFRKAIKNIAFLPGFQDSLSNAFERVLGGEIGTIPVFIRSDTNMEDLKDFTGAGLNLTVFNVVDRDKIFQAIRDVWASPYTERSYRWRQKYLLNPENVYPSILIIPTVNVDKSGVMITTGVGSSNLRDITVAFNRGAGGAVEGQMAESYLLMQDQSTNLISPTRELMFTSLPNTGGILKVSTALNVPILSGDNLKHIRELAQNIRQKLGEGPFDVELGFKDEKIWLFQIRPYVESKRALASAYLRSRDSVLHSKKTISLDDPY